jgi:hypothetical protein
MIDEPLPFLSSGYLFMLSVLCFSRGMDFLSTWVATPNLVLEGNPIAKRMGWKLGGIVNLALCFTFAFLPLVAIIISTTSVLVASRNFQQAWLMRSLGEEAYRSWYLQRFYESHFPLFLFCLFAQTLLTAAVGGAIVFFSRTYVPMAIGFGIVAYAVTVLFYTLLSVWRLRRAMARA